jgi:hypothetical protein
MRRLVMILMLTLSLLMLGAQTITAQTPTPAVPGDGNICAAFTTEELTSAVERCSLEALEGSSVCYASAEAVIAPLEGDALAQPGDTLPLTDLSTIRTSEKGIAIIRLDPEDEAEDAENPSRAYAIVIGEGVLFERADEELTDSFFISNTINDTCTETPEGVALVVIGDLPFEFTINGGVVRLDRTAFLRVVEPGNTLQIITTEGTVTLAPDSDFQVDVPAGLTSVVCLFQPTDLGVNADEPNQQIVEGCNWTEPRELTEVEFNYAVSLQQVIDALLQVAPPESACANGGTTVVHSVRSGENLFRIARRYTITVSAIVAVNSIANPNALSVGQQLTIECAIDTGLPTQGAAVPVAPPVVPPVVPPSTGF